MSAQPELRGLAVNVQGAGGVRLPEPEAPARRMALVASDNHRAPRMLCPLGKTALAAFRRVAAVFLLLVAVPAMTTSTRGDSYPKIEASFSITNLATDPFDYIVTDVRVQVLQPDSSTL